MYLCVYMFMCMNTGVHMSQSMWGGQRTTSRVGPHLWSHLRRALLSSTAYARGASLSTSGDSVPASPVSLGMMGLRRLAIPAPEESYLSPNV